jgi:hypothetical protein
VAKAKRDAAAKKQGELKQARHKRWEKVKDDAEIAFGDPKMTIGD